MGAGVEGLRRDKTRPARKKPLSAEVKLKVLTKTANETPANATHWSTRSMAKEIGISRTSVQRIWAEAGLKPHLVRTFKVSNDPKFVEKVTDAALLHRQAGLRAIECLNLALLIDAQHQRFVRRVQVEANEGRDHDASSGLTRGL